MIAAERHIAAMQPSTTHAERAPSVRPHSPWNDMRPVWGVGSQGASGVLTLTLNLTLNDIRPVSSHDAPIK